VQRNGRRPHKPLHIDADMRVGRYRHGRINGDADIHFVGPRRIELQSRHFANLDPVEQDHRTLTEANGRSFEQNTVFGAVAECRCVVQPVDESESRGADRKKKYPYEEISRPRFHSVPLEVRQALSEC
jgi:hypothetical protein